VAERLAPSQEGLGSMELVTQSVYIELLDDNALEGMCKEAVVARFTVRWS
jgi:hypothetical protein